MANNKLNLNFSFDHYAIEVRDLEKSLFFYHNILGLPIINRPNFDFEGAWLGLPNRQAIHLIVSSDEIPASTSRKLHFAFAHNDIHSLEIFLKNNNITTVPIKTRPDGILQLFVKDTDGYFVEFCEK